MKAARFHRWPVGHRAGLLLLGACLACGPLVGEGTGGGGGSETQTVEPSASGTSAASTTQAASTTGGSTSSEDTDTSPEPACPPDQSLVPGYCFERYDIDLPGPLVMERAVGADIDGDGIDALVLELELDGESMLTVWDFDEAVGATLNQEVALDDVGEWPSGGDFEHTRLLAGAYLPAGEEPSGVESIYRTEIDAIRLCDPDETTHALGCVVQNAPSEFPHPIVMGHMFTCCGGDDITTASQYGVAFLSPTVTWVYGDSTPPCDALTALAHGDVNGDDFFDIVYRSSADCMASDAPGRHDVGVYLGWGLDPAPPIDPGIETDLLLALDVDGDGAHEVLAARAGDPQGAYRLLSWAASDTPSVQDALGPPRVDRLDKGDLRGDGSADVLYVGAATHLAPSPLEPSLSLPAELGRLLAVVDANGDGLDDLLLSGPSPGSFVTLLLSR